MNFSTLILYSYLLEFKK